MLMFLVQSLLPLADNSGNAFPDSVLRAIHEELAEKFGGFTAYSRAPAKGVWTSGGGKRDDDIVIVEVMVEKVDEQWWTAFRERVERTLKQDKLIVRCQEMRYL